MDVVDFDIIIIYLFIYYLIFVFVGIEEKYCQTFFCCFITV